MSYFPERALGFKHNYRDYIRHLEKNTSSELYEKLHSQAPETFEERSKIRKNFTFAFGIWQGYEGMDIENALGYVLTPIAFHDYLSSHSGTPPLLLTEAEGLAAIKRHGVALKTPLDMGSESIALGFIFTVVVTLINEIKQTNPDTNLILIIGACVVLYPFLYSMFSRCKKCNPGHFATKDVAKEALTLGILLVGALTGLSFWTQKDLLDQPSIGGAVVAVLKQLISAFQGRSLTAMNKDTALQFVKDTVLNWSIFSTIITALNAMAKFGVTQLSPAVQMMINFASVVALINILGRLFPMLYQKLESNKFCGCYGPNQKGFTLVEPGDYVAIDMSETIT